MTGKSILKRESIFHLVSAASILDPHNAFRAALEIYHRQEELTDHYPALVGLLGAPISSVVDLVMQLIRQIGRPIVHELLAGFRQSEGKVRRHLLGLIIEMGQFEEWYPLVKSEIEQGTGSSRYWAAIYLGRACGEGADWESDATELLDHAIEILNSYREDSKNWPQAEFTLRRLGRLPWENSFDQKEV